MYIVIHIKKKTSQQSFIISEKKRIALKNV